MTAMKKRIVGFFGLFIFLLIVICFAFILVSCGEAGNGSSASAITRKTVSTTETSHATTTETTIETTETTAETTSETITETTTETVTETSTETTSETTTENPTEKTVYVTPSGKRYHFSASCAGKNALPTTLSKAEEDGYTPCQKCAK